MIKLLSPAQNQCVLGKNQREEVNAMRKYEIMYIINPTVLEEGREELINQVNALLTSNGATIAKTEKWGERKLAYPIDKKKSGFYVLTTFEIDGTKLAEVEAKLNIMESVMRYIVVKQD